MAFILASSSPRRLELLRQIGRPPDHIQSADIDESLIPGEMPRALAVRLAGQKAEAISAQYPEDVVLAADTVVACGRRVLGKPRDEQEARAFLSLLSGRRHRVYGGICVVSPMRRHQRIVETVVTFKRLSLIEMNAYLATTDWRDKAGGYGIQGPAGAFVKCISGSYTNVVGLCVYTAQNVLTAALDTSG